jgi:hypothetical protein
MGSIIDRDRRRRCQIDIELSGDFGAGRHRGWRRGNHHQQHRTGRTDGQERAGRRRTCLGSVSGGGAFVGTGFSFGTTIPDPGCAARLDARTLWSFGLKKAALARLCLNPDINRAMPEVCDKYLPPPPPSHPAPPSFLARFAAAQASDEQPYTGGDIWLVDGATGKKRLCNDYDVTQQSCRVWAHVVHHSRPKKKAIASGETSHTAASPAPAIAVAATEKKEKKQ